MIKNRPSFPRGRPFLSSGIIDTVTFCSGDYEIYQLASGMGDNEVFGINVHCKDENEVKKIFNNHKKWWQLTGTTILQEKNSIPFRDHFLLSMVIRIDKKTCKAPVKKGLFNQNQSILLLQNLLQWGKIARENEIVPIIEMDSYLVRETGESFIVIPLIVADPQKGFFENLGDYRSIVKVIYHHATGIIIEQNLPKPRDIAHANKWNQEIDEPFSNFLQSMLTEKKPSFSVSDLETAFEKMLKKEKYSEPRKIEREKQRSTQESWGLGKIAGMKKLKEVLTEEIIRPLQNPEPYKRYQITIPNGILLYGPPGCGKTFIARQLAEELDYYFLEVSPSDIASPFIHDSVLRIQNLFDDAETHAPSIVFIDEFDAFVPSRSSLGGHQQFKSEEVNEFLHNLSNCSEKGIVILAATNEPEKIDNAILRTGRFDKLVYVEPPDLEARIDLLKIYLQNRPHDPIGFSEIARTLEGYSCSDVKNIIDDAARIALKQGIPIIQDHIIDSISRNPSSLTGDVIAKYSSQFQRGITDNRKKGENVHDDDSRYIY